jgi:hypothetical protein
MDWLKGWHFNNASEVQVALRCIARAYAWQLPKIF